MVEEVKSNIPTHVGNAAATQSTEQPQANHVQAVDTEITDFDHYFPVLVEACQDLNRQHGQAPEQFYDKFDDWVERVDREISGVLGEPWTQLCRQNEGYVAEHTIVVLTLVLADPLMPTFTVEERNMLKWAALLHDIAKLSTPAIQGKDHIHPFKSAKIVLDIFERYNFIPDLHRN